MISARLHISKVDLVGLHKRSYTSQQNTEILISKETTLVHKVFLNDYLTFTVIDTRQCTDEMIQKAREEDPMFDRHVRIVANFGEKEVHESTFGSMALLVANLIRNF